MTAFDDFIARLESLGLSEVRVRLSQGVWANRRKQWAEDWIKEKERLANTDQVEKGSFISAKAGQLSRESNDINREILRTNQSMRNASWANAWVLAVSVAVPLTLSAISYWR